MSNINKTPMNLQVLIISNVWVTFPVINDGCVSCSMRGGKRLAGAGHVFSCGSPLVQERRELTL